MKEFFCELRNWKHEGENKSLGKISSWKKTVRVEKKLQGEMKTLRDEKLYIEVYRRWENLRFYGIRKASGNTDENVKEVLVGFMQNELDISEADTIEFHKIHCIWRLYPSQDKPTPIITWSLWNSDRVGNVMDTEAARKMSWNIGRPTKWYCKLQIGNDTKV